MMDELLWTFEKLRRFAQHQDAPVRRWALNRLIQLDQVKAGEVVVDMVPDTGNFISYKALDFLAETDESEKFGPAY